ALTVLESSGSNLHRVHRPAHRSEIASIRSSQILGLDSEETAPELLSRIGAHTEVTKPICFETEAGPTSAGCS
ncbi:MAG: hypothetical protein ACR2NZ_08885, partial [Rubripirellula sp.]